MMTTLLRYQQCFKVKITKNGGSPQCVNSGYIHLGKAIELVNQIYETSKSESVPPDQLPDYVKQKLEEKQKIEEDIKAAYTVLQSKNMSIETINEHVKLNEKLNEYNLSFQDIDKLMFW
jgi:uncharacterized protein (UPF0335 family)